MAWVNSFCWEHGFGGPFQFASILLVAEKHWVAHLVGIVGLDCNESVPRDDLPADRTEVGDVFIACEETSQSLDEFPCHFGTTSWV